MLSFRLEKETSENVTDTTFNMFEINIYKSINRGEQHHCLHSRRPGDYGSSRPEVLGGKCVSQNSQEISQNSQENTCTRAPFLIKLQASGVPVNFAEFSRGPIFIEQLRWLLLGLMVFGEEE